MTFLAPDGMNLDTLTLAFNRAFIGYYAPLTQTPETLATMIATNDVSLVDSLVAKDVNGALAGIGLLAVRERRGWIAGMGLAPDWRGKGQGELLMRRLIERARALGLERLQLEVLDENAPARRLYTRLGFRERRPLAIFDGPVAQPPRQQADEAPAAAPLDVAAALQRFAEMHPVEPSWQREPASLARMAGLRAIGLYEDGRLATYSLYHWNAPVLALLDMGVAPSTGKRGITNTAHIVEQLLAGRSRTTVRAINVPPGDPLGETLRGLGCPITTRQQEMELDLGASLSWA
jgi:GNAT superfamily N-acetyltransferase